MDKDTIIRRLISSNWSREDNGEDISLRFWIYDLKKTFNPDASIKEIEDYFYNRIMEIASEE